MGVEDPGVTEGPVVMEDTTGVAEDPGVMEYITGVMEGIMATEVIMAEAITMEVRASSSAGTLGFLTTTRTVIILTPIIIRIPPHIPITLML
jgi:hypothetical protein